MHSGGFELTILTYTRLEVNLTPHGIQIGDPPANARGSTGPKTSALFFARKCITCIEDDKTGIWDIFICINKSSLRQKMFGVGYCFTSWAGQTFRQLFCLMYAL